MGEVLVCDSWTVIGYRHPAGGDHDPNSVARPAPLHRVVDEVADGAVDRTWIHVYYRGLQFALEGHGRAAVLASAHRCAR
jgi:hypothetical protein